METKDIEQYSALYEEAKEVKKALNLESIYTAILLAMNDLLIDIRNDIGER